MKEIINHGIFVNTKICPKCGCEFLFTQKEIKHQTITYPFDLYFYESYDIVTCPECDEEIKII